MMKKIKYFHAIGASGALGFASAFWLIPKGLAVAVFSSLCSLMMVAIACYLWYVHERNKTFKDYLKKRK